MRGKRILVTGGTGSFGQAFIAEVLATQEPKSICVFSRDELKQAELQALYPNERRLRFFIGDVRDLERLRMAMRDVDIVIHAAAMKRIEMCESNPFEAVQTNVIGTQNVITAAIENGVSQVLALSTDKAANPVNLYGASKLCLEKLVVGGNVYAGRRKTKLAVCRYGNVFGSRGSVALLFKKQAAEGNFTITDFEMTRFVITLPQAVKFILTSLEMMTGGETFVPKLPSMKIVDLAEASATGPFNLSVVGLRPGEKLHECMLTEDEARHTVDIGDRFIIQPEFKFWSTPSIEGKKLPAGFRYDSGTNHDWLTVEQLKQMESFT